MQIQIDNNIIIDIKDEIDIYIIFKNKNIIYKHCIYKQSNNIITHTHVKRPTSINDYYNIVFVPRSYSFYLKSKMTREKCRYIKNILDIYNIIVYTYYIHKKYYMEMHGTTYDNLIEDSITYKKLFNCRDFYRIYSYI